MNPTEKTLARAIDIGETCLAIDSAIGQLQVAYSNAGHERFDTYSTGLFNALSLRREVLRSELLFINDAIEGSK